MPDKKEALKQIIRSLHEGATIENAKRRFAAEVGTVDTAELVSIEQALIEEGLTPEEVTRFCNVHVQLVQDSLEKVVDKTAEPPAIVALRSENAVIRGLTGKVRLIAERADHGRPLNEVLGEVEDELAQLKKVGHHYAVKENTLFPYLELHGFSGPSQVMWAKDDEIRSMTKTALSAIRSVETEETWRGFRDGDLYPLLDEIDGMVDKEQDILFPACLDRLDSEEWAQASIAVDESGAAFERPAGREPEPGAASRATVGDGELVFPSGRLSVAQLGPLLNALPLDITFVDADDRVAFFTEGGDRIFMRPRSVLGRKVQNCHPPKSLDAVMSIVSDFKSGERDVAEFWLTIEGRFVYIRYFAVRDGDGTYLGTVEITQDITDIRALEGEKRL